MAAEKSVVDAGIAESSSASPHRKAFFVVLNSGSGSGDGEDAGAAIAAVLSGAGRQCTLLRVEDGSQLQATAAQAVEQAGNCDGIVVAAGGDGTLNAVCQALIGSRLPLGVVPLGTFNYFARNHGLPLDTTLAARCLLDARIEPVQVGLLNDRVFLVNASVGLYPQLLEERETYKRRFGRSRLIALLSALRTLLHAHRTLSVRVDIGGRAQHMRTASLVVANNALQLEHIGVEFGDALDRGQLVTMVVRPIGKLALYGLLLRGLLRRLGSAEHLNSFAVTRMRVSRARSRRIKVALDGEVSRMRLPLRFAAAERSLPLLVPRDPAKRERF